MKSLTELDLGNSLLSLAIILGWLGISFIFLRIIAISIKRLLEAVFKNPK